MMADQSLPRPNMDAQPTLPSWLLSPGAFQPYDAQQPAPSGTTNTNVEIPSDNCPPRANGSIIDLARDYPWWRRAQKFLRIPKPLAYTLLERRNASALPEIFPPDPASSSRSLDMMHHVWHILLDSRLYLAPVSPKDKLILHLSGKTGIWPIHLRVEYPEAKLVAGLSDGVPDFKEKWVPENVVFSREDLEPSYRYDLRQWRWDWPVKQHLEASGGWDLIHCGPAAGLVCHWDQLVRRIYNSLRPGGWAEFWEEGVKIFNEDDSIPENDLIVAQMKTFVEDAEKAKYTLDPGPRLEEWMKEAGFERVTTRKFKMPIGEWPRDGKMKVIGGLKALRVLDTGMVQTNKMLEQQDGEQSTGGLAALHEKWERRAKEMTALHNRMKSTLEDPHIHRMIECYVVMGQKPR